LLEELVHRLEELVHRLKELVHRLEELAHRGTLSLWKAFPPEGERAEKGIQTPDPCLGKALLYP
jgi:hypothetical protein